MVMARARADAGSIFLTAAVMREKTVGSQASVSAATTG